MTYFYYLRNADKRPLITVCLHSGDDGTTCRGIALCSPKDSPNKRVGRAIASGRATQAMKNKRQAGAIHRSDAWDVLDEVDGVFWFKSMYCPELTPFETKLLKPNKGERK